MTKNNEEDKEKKVLLTKLTEESLSFYYEGKFEDAANLCVKAMKICKSTGNEEFFADLSMMAGKTFLGCKNYSKSRKHIETALEIHNKLEKHDFVGIDYQILAEIESNAGNHEKAVICFKKS